jgi:hypothetical protein
MMQAYAHNPIYPLPRYQLAAEEGNLERKKAVSIQSGLERANI